MQLLFEIRIRKTCKPLTPEHFTSHNLNLQNFKIAIDIIEYRKGEKYQYQDIGVYSLHIRWILDKE